MHIGVGAIIANKNRDQFFVQQKDENYPFVQFRGALSFWGGAMEEKDASLLDALKRELEEELQVLFPFQKDNINFIETFMLNTEKEPFRFHLFEVMLEEEAFSLLKNAIVLEGRGAFLEKEALLSSDWIWGLEEVAQFYAELKH